jgi:hypothetical protein
MNQRGGQCHRLSYFDRLPICSCDFGGVGLASARRRFRTQPDRLFWSCRLEVGRYKQGVLRPHADFMRSIRSTPTIRFAICVGFSEMV